MGEMTHIAIAGEALVKGFLAGVKGLKERERGMKEKQGMSAEQAVEEIREVLRATPYMDEDIQKMQDLEQAEIQKAYDLGFEEGERFAVQNGCNRLW